MKNPACGIDDHPITERPASIGDKDATAVCCDQCGLALIRLNEPYTPVGGEITTVHIGPVPD